MKKVAVIPAVVLAALCTFTGCKKEEVEKVIAPLVSDRADYGIHRRSPGRKGSSYS